MSSIIFRLNNWNTCIEWFFNMHFFTALEISQTAFATHLTWIVTTLKVNLCDLKMFLPDGVLTFCILICYISSDFFTNSQIHYDSCSSSYEKICVFFTPWTLAALYIWSKTFYKGAFRPQISNWGRYSISNINQQLTICQQMLKIWCINLFFAMLWKKLVHL